MGWCRALGFAVDFMCTAALHAAPTPAQWRHEHALSSSSFVMLCVLHLVDLSLWCRFSIPTTSAPATLHVPLRLALWHTLALCHTCAPSWMSPEVLKVEHVLDAMGSQDGSLGASLSNAMCLVRCTSLNPLALVFLENEAALQEMLGEETFSKLICDGMLERLSSTDTGELEVVCRLCTVRGVGADCAASMFAKHGAPDAWLRGPYGMLDAQPTGHSPLALC